MGSCVVECDFWNGNESERHDVEPIVLQPADTSAGAVDPKQVERID